MSDNPLRDALEIERHATREIERSEYLTARSFAVKYGVSLRQVRKWIAQSAVIYYRKGRLIRVLDRRPDRHAA